MNIYRNLINFNVTKSPKSKKTQLIKILKIIFFIFLITSVLWGCGQGFISQGLMPGTELKGSDAALFKGKQGLFFEITYGDQAREKLLHIDADGKQYYWFPISTWKDMWIHAQYSPFYGLFVYPIAWFLIIMIHAFGGVNTWYGPFFAIFFTIFVIKSLMLLATFKSQKDQEKNQKLQTQTSVIKAKYKGLKDPISKRKQQTEIMMLYKKNNCSPFSSIGSAFIPLPVMIALYTMVRSVSLLKQANLGSISFIDAPWTQITQHKQYVYISVLFICFLCQLFSVLLPNILSYTKDKLETPEFRAGKKKQLMTSLLMNCVFLIAIATSPVALSLYWTFTAVFEIVKILVFHYWKIYSVNQQRKHKLKKKHV